MEASMPVTTRSFRRRAAAAALRHLGSALVVSYLLTLCFPQYLFAHAVTYRSFRVYSREPLDRRMDKVLDGAEARLIRSTIYDPDLRRSVFLTDSHLLYGFLSNKAFRSFANSVPLIDNVLVNESDAGSDLVFLDRPEHDRRSLSGVIAHEVTHLFIRESVGTLPALLMPAWKSEGYCEYIAGDSAITYEEGVRLWRENPQDDSRYRHFKYHMMVKYLLETERLDIEDVFNRDFDTLDLEDRAFRSL